MNRIGDKINEINKYLDELADIVPGKFEKYKSSNLVKAACERYFEKIVEAITDVAFMIIAKKKFEIPEDDIDAFRILLEHKIIREELYKKLKDAKGMRNIISHEYGKIDDKIVFESIKEKLEKDIKEFIDNTKKSAKQISGELRNSQKRISGFPEKPEVFLRVPEMHSISKDVKQKI